MEKTPRYTQRERNMVLGYAAQYKDVIENKRTDAESNRKKDEVWRNIAKEFNSKVYHQRTAKQLRQLYKNMKLLLKKDLSADSSKSESFMDILTALSAQQTLTTFHSNNNKIQNSQRSHKRYHHHDDKNNLDFDSSENIESDVVIIKSEDISDNENATIKNADDDDDEDDDDDSISNKDIPEVCLEEDDDELFHPDDNNYNRITTTPNHHHQHQPSYLSLHQQQQLQDLEDQKNLQQQQHYHQQQQQHLQQQQQQHQNALMGSSNDSLLSLAIEERKRKIELLNTQIEYWKTLTKKLEMTNTNNPITTAAVAGINCPCHLGTAATRVNGCNQS